MKRVTTERLRGLAFLVSGVVAMGLIVYLVVDPAALAGLHPLPLIGLLVVTVLVTIHQARRYLR